MASETSSLEEDCDLFIKIFSDLELFEDNEDLASTLEDISLFWTDDLGFVLNVIVRSLETLRAHETKANLVCRLLLEQNNRQAVKKRTQLLYCIAGNGIGH